MYPSHGWSETCAEFHIWKRSCRCLGGVNAAEHDEQCGYICTSLSQEGQSDSLNFCDVTTVALVDTRFYFEIEPEDRRTLWTSSLWDIYKTEGKMRFWKRNHNFFNFNIAWCNTALIRPACMHNWKQPCLSLHFFVKVTMLLSLRCSSLFLQL